MNKRITRKPDISKWQNHFFGKRTYRDLTPQDFAKEILVSVHAVTLDLVNLNLQFQSVVHLPDTSFEELAEAWRSPDTPDRREHDTLATLEFEASTIRLGCHRAVVDQLWTN